MAGRRLPRAKMSQTNNWRAERSRSQMVLPRSDYDVARARKRQSGGNAVA
jgi:hypothetical protein